MKTNRLIIFLQLVTILSAIGLFSGAQAAAIVVHMDVNESGTKLFATTTGTCKRQNSPGCVHASGNVQINFMLNDPNCSLDYIALGDSGGISAVAASDFNADPESGIVTPISEGGNHILIRDNNTEAYDIAYTVYATCDGNQINSDPRVENDGTGR